MQNANVGVMNLIIEPIIKANQYHSIKKSMDDDVTNEQMNKLSAVFDSTPTT